jgi:hypothetical protein
VASVVGPSAGALAGLDRGRDCTSFVVMTELRIADAITTDRHFRLAGFRPLLGRG